MVCRDFSIKSPGVFRGENFVKVGVAGRGFFSYGGEDDLDDVADFAEVDFAVLRLIAKRDGVLAELLCGVVEQAREDGVREFKLFDFALQLFVFAGEHFECGNGFLLYLIVTLSSVNLSFGFTVESRSGS